tara:strand:+ start:1387 stop:2115 length:729 start_codon:yes stop_codon:yes gene_type:complete
MFRQKRKQRYEITAHVDQLTDGMTARDLTEHLRFWKIVDKWHPEPSTNKDFLIAVERKLKKLTQEEGKKNKQKNISDAKSLIDNLNKLDKTVLKEIVEVGIFDPKFKKALTTQKTDHGVKVGSFLIKIRPFKKRYMYDIHNLTTSEVVVKDIKLYEMAFCLVNYMNDELLHTDPKMVELHEIYNDYTKYSTAASHCKIMYFEAKKSGEKLRESKNQLEFEKNRDLALKCKAKIVDLFRKNTE